MPGSRSNAYSQCPSCQAIFAFVFGRGDPNDTLEARRWQAIGLLLRANRGREAIENNHSTAVRPTNRVRTSVCYVFQHPDFRALSPTNRVLISGLHVVLPPL